MHKYSATQSMLAKISRRWRTSTSLAATSSRSTLRQARERCNGIGIFGTQLSQLIRSKVASPVVEQQNFQVLNTIKIQPCPFQFHSSARAQYACACRLEQFR